MKRKLYIDYDTYKWLLKSINDISLKDSVHAAKQDLDFIKDEMWLSDTAVIDRVEKRKGTYHISLVFAHFSSRFKLIIRSITHNSCPKRAALMSQVFKRQAAKDQRGTITIDEDSLDVSYN